MSIRLKLKLSRAITSLQFCRSTRTPSSVITPNSSNKPKSSSSHVGFKRPEGCSKQAGYRSSSRSQPPEYSSGEKIGGFTVQAYLHTRCPLFCDRSTEGHISPVKLTSTKNMVDKNKNRRRRRSLSTDDGFSFIRESEETKANDETEETEEGLSYDYSLGGEGNNSVKQVINPTKKKAINNNVQSFSGMRTRTSKTRKGSSSSSTGGTGKMTGSAAVVKISENPYIDFKKSMLDMILQKQMYEGKDLEELLQCFLSLNSRQYYGVIVHVFSEIWEILFSEPLVKRNII
ncbi:hypothetical protein K2173_027910 [Erythroxylum novogranatense]|uniref:Transcription repressor n=1 Tax=Erythroxylum novogranatense TaxID=1862640 RepID=A0AAV8U2Z7_9ROSI|nr:hypothetical protein K2173_027910 [Erythroxylum novogranatense]